jgi:lysophospholipase L1-like esterase
MTTALAGAAAARPSWPALAAGTPGQSTAARPPFEMLVLGDSVVWGQGLPEEQKFYSAVRGVLVSEILRRSDVRMVVRAHSGATIMPRGEFSPRNYGEVPVGAPTLYAQANMAAGLYDYLGVPRTGVRFVLLNGGINDIGFPTLINPFTRDGKLRAAIEQSCRVDMRDLLAFLARMYPNALLLVTGYFSIITEQTKESTLRDLIRAFLNRRDVARADEEGLRQAARLRAGRGWLFERLEAMSKTWKAESDAAFTAAAAEINGDRTFALAGGCPRVLFAKVDLKSDEGYNAPNSALWRITEEFKTEDPMYEHRRDPGNGVCHPPKNRLKGLEQQICDLAATGHPKHRGAEIYVKSIVEQLRQCGDYLAGQS